MGKDRVETIAVLGGTGFLGRHFVNEVSGRKMFDVRVLTRDQEMGARLAAEGICVVHGDMLEPSTMDDLLKDVRTVVNLAFIGKPLEANIEAIRNLVDACNNSQVTHVVHCSTASVVGRGGPKYITEETVCVPSTEYERLKYQVEQGLASLLNPDIRVTIVRPTEILGRGGVGLHCFIDYLRFGKPLSKRVRGFILGHRHFNYVHVLNVVEALVTLLDVGGKRGDREVYYVSDDEDSANYYCEVENIVRSRLHGTFSKRKFMLPAKLLDTIFLMLNMRTRRHHSFSNTKIRAIGYRRRKSIIDAVTEVLDDVLGSEAKHTSEKYERDSGIHVA